MMPPSLAELLDETLRQQGVELGVWVLAWARFVPALVLVPAFGLKAVPAPVRVALGACLGLTIVPSLQPEHPTWPWSVQIGLELLRGLPVALSAAMSLWIAVLVGGLVDDLRGSRERAAIPVLPPGATPSGALLALLASMAFLESGGVGRVVAVLTATVQVTAQPIWLHLASELAGGVQIALAVGAPLAVAAMVLEVAGALVARAASPAFIHPVLAPVRSVGLLLIFALLFDRVVALLTLLAAQAPSG